LENSLLTSTLSATEIENIRRESSEQFDSDPGIAHLSLALELSKREEDARLNRLREEEEELEKVRRNTQKMSTDASVF
jgi:hypothetical protein